MSPNAVSIQSPTERWPWTTLVVRGPWRPTYDELWLRRRCEALKWDARRVRAADVAHVGQLAATMRALVCKLGGLDPSPLMGKEIEHLQLESAYGGPVNVSPMLKLQQLEVVGAVHLSGLAMLPAMSHLSMTDPHVESLVDFIPENLSSLDLAWVSPEAPGLLHLPTARLAGLEWLRVEGIQVANLEAVLQCLLAIERLIVRQTASPSSTGAVSVSGLLGASRLLSVDILGQGEVQDANSLLLHPTLQFARLGPAKWTSELAAPNWRVKAGDGQVRLERESRDGRQDI